MKYVLYAILFACMAALMAGAVMWLWNALLPEITGWKTISYWQALGLLVLMRLLSGGFRFGSHGKHRFAGPHGRGHLRDKWMNMTEEEKLRFRQEWKKRCESRQDIP
ncbi:MAG: hypothetical protein JNL57_05790 [Bacteroidetes bacterium]|nr:hypothetical protein [Bacteroidota bacterium]